MSCGFRTVTATIPNVIYSQFESAASKDMSEDWYTIFRRIGTLSARIKPSYQLSLRK